MSVASKPKFEPGRVYRTRDLAQWAANAPRLAHRLVRDGKLIQLAHGLLAAPKYSRFGLVPPSNEAIMRAFLNGGTFIFTGPEFWNALGLNTTAVFARPLVYNKKRSGLFVFGGREFLLRRVEFPDKPPLEWYVIDLFENAEPAAASREELRASLTVKLRSGKFDRDRLDDMARHYGSRRTQQLVRHALDSSVDVAA